MILGVLIAVATFVDLNTGLCGIIAIGTAALFRIITKPSKGGYHPFDYYNPLLVGLSIGVRFKLSLLTFILILASAILTYVLTVVLKNLLGKYTALPVLSLPFVIVSSMVYLATLRSSNLFANVLIYHSPVTYFDLPIWINGYFFSLGAIFFSKNIIVGYLISGALLIHSRIMFFLSIAGYYTGALVTGEFNAAHTTTYQDMNYFNYILIAIAIGSIYLIPSIKSYVIALFAVLGSYVVLGATEVLFQNFSLPVFTLPFNITVLFFIYYSSIINSRLSTYTYLKNPESNLDYHINYTKRFELTFPGIALPFSGEWTISQAFNGLITHKGLWRYGVDFVIEDEQNQQFSGSADVLKNYYAFSKPVLSPIAGNVVEVINNIEDNAVGSINREDNWGNYVLIYDLRGFYVKVCHLEMGSVIPATGAYVTVGQKIGCCGNSGYSPTPHIHIQLQTGVNNNHPTIEFQFEQVADNNSNFFNRITPEKDMVLTPVFSSKKKKRIFELLLGDLMEFSIDDGNSKKNETIEVILDENGASCLKCGAALLYFEVHKNVFRFYKYFGPTSSILKYFFHAIPSIPLCDNNLIWTDRLSLNISLRGFMKNFILILQSFYWDIADNNVNCKFTGNYKFETHNITRLLSREVGSTKSEVKIHDKKFIEHIRIQKNGSIININRIKEKN
ncbi:urea transporter [bacterium]|nr:urea transporter [bacterium]